MLIDKVIIAAGGLAISAIAVSFAASTGPDLAAQLHAEAQARIASLDARAVQVRFTSAGGWPSRHATLSNAGNLPDSKRETIAKAVGSVTGVGGVFWSDGTANAESSAPITSPLHCQEDVEALLRARTIRFEESSAAIDPASRILLDEVAEALRPCTGAIVAIIGHTDQSGAEAANLELSYERALSVRRALERRGIPGDALRTRGLGSREPVEGLDPADPANRRIEFEVVETKPVVPTPVDTPGAR